jgi:uncharacterized membrane protein YkoI
MRWASILAVACLLTLGCGESHQGDEVVPINQLPASALKAAQEKLPDVKFDTAWKEKAEGKDAYEIRGKTKNGRVRDVKVTADGQVLEVD